MLSGDAQNGSTHPHGWLLSRDLMFISKITGTAAALGLRIESVGSMPLPVPIPTLKVVLIDLNCADFDPKEVITQLGNPRPVVIAFGSHVDTARLDQAQAAGCEEVMPRSRFSASLPELLQKTIRGR